MGPVIAVMCSVWRPGNVVADSIAAAAAEPLIDTVVVFGYNPINSGATYARISTVYHSALRRHVHESTTDNLCEKRFKFCGTDPVRQIKWRAKLALDMWATLVHTRKKYPNATIVWLENDVILIKGALSAALAAANTHGAAACYGVGPTYIGIGTQCLVLTPRVNPAPHLLAYHLVQPADWIMSDYSKGVWPLRVAARCCHGQHVSTRLL